MHRVGIVICNYNKKDMVCACIRAIFAQTYTDYDLYVVDNASDDGSADAIRQHFGGRLILLVNTENLGGSGGFNTGLRKAYANGHTYLMCVDNDALPEKDAVGALVNFLDTHAECGMAASKIYHLEQPDTVQNFGQSIDFVHFATEAMYLGCREDGTMPPFVYADAVPACSLMVRREVIDAIGFLPEENFLYWDDTQWSWQCNLAGYKAASVGASKARHSMGAKREDVTTFPTYYAWRNWLAFFLKFTPEEDLLRMALTFLTSIFQEQFEGYHREEYRRAETVMAAYDDAIHGITGKAGPGRIADVDTNRTFYRKMLSEARYFTVLENGHSGMLEWLEAFAAEEGFSDVRFTAVQTAEEALASTCAGDACGIVFCESIFAKEAGGILKCLREEYASGAPALRAASQVDGSWTNDAGPRDAAPDDGADMSRLYFVDIHDCIVRADRLPGLRGDYEKGRELFLSSQLPLFLRQADILRGYIP